MKNESTFSLTVNDVLQLSATAQQAYAIDALRIDDARYHVLANHKGYEVQLLAHNKAQKTVTLQVNDHKYTVKIADPYDTLVTKMGLSAAKAKKISQLKAPMPGLVRAIPVKVGDTVAQGEPLLILEAMKMENVIKAMTAVTIKQIHIEEGNVVDKGTLLIDFA